MKLLHIAAFDAAAAAWNYSQAVNAYTEHRAEVMTHFATKTAPDAHYHASSADADRVHDALVTADLLVWHPVLWDFARKGWASTAELVTMDIEHTEIAGVPLLEFYDSPRSMIWLDGSTALRANVRAYRKKFERFAIVATTPDLCELFDAEFMPCCIPDVCDRGALAVHRDWTVPRLTVAHAPTDPAIKNTEDLDIVCAMLPDIRWWVFQNLTWVEAAIQRSQAHVSFDHMQGYFGCCSSEASAMGQVNLVHISETSRGYLERYCDGDMPPWIDCRDRETLSAGLRTVLDDRKMGEATARATREWYERRWRNETKARRLIRWLKG